MTTIFVAQTSANLPALASLYSQLAGVLAGFAFAALITLMAAQLATNASGSTLKSSAPLLAAFLALAIASLNYALLAGEGAESTRLATLQASSGAGFGVAGMMLLYSILAFVRGLEVDASNSASVSSEMAKLIRLAIILAVCPLILLLIWGGVRDHLTAKYGPAVGFTALDVFSLLVVVLTILLNVIFMVLFSDGQNASSSAVGLVSSLAVGLAAASLLTATVTIAFMRETAVMPDYIPAAAVLVAGAFTVVLSHSTSRLRF